MIRYRLQCAELHTFDAWFANSAAYDQQAPHGMIACTTCGSTSIEKALMAPAVGKKANRKPEATSASVPDAPATGQATGQAPAAASNVANNVALTGEAAKQAAVARELASLMRRLRAEVEAKAEYVGPNFAEEARKIHYDEAPDRGIYGEASRADVVALLDEGIEIMPLPVLPDDKN
jgi:hypothetical protein